MINLRDFLGLLSLGRFHEFAWSKNCPSFYFVTDTQKAVGIFTAKNILFNHGLKFNFKQEFQVSFENSLEIIAEKGYYRTLSKLVNFVVDKYDTEETTPLLKDIIEWGRNDFPAGINYTNSTNDLSLHIDKDIVSFKIFRNNNVVMECGRIRKGRFFFEQYSEKIYAEELRKLYTDLFQFFRIDKRNRVSDIQQIIPASVWTLAIES
jgi:hypothetical protein